jgi:periplasmic protein TonB
MEAIKQKKKNHTIISAVCISLLIHFAVGALLISGLHNNLISSPKLNGINLVWISLDNQSKNSGVELKNVQTQQLSPAVERTTEKQANVEKPAAKPQTAQISTAAVRESANAIPLPKQDSSAMGVKGQHYNITEYSENKSFGKTSHLNTVIAYPLYKENTPPVYPEIARARGYEGIVLVYAEILPDGRVGEIKIRKSSGYAILDQSAIQAVKPWKFEPAKKSGNPFTAWVELPIKFILHNGGSQS